MQTFELPPSYHVTDELPEYSSHLSPPSAMAASTSTRRHDSKEFSYQMKNRKGRPWLTMTMMGSSLLSKQIPIIVEGSSVEGKVLVNLDAEDGIQAVTVTAFGRIISGANAGESYTFLRTSTCLWSKSSGNSNSGGPTKLSGEHFWTYKLDIPKQVTLDLGPSGQGQTYSLPQTFLERHSRVSVQYDLVVRASRGKLRPDSKLTATFGFMPVVQPGSPSLLRQLAYQERSPLIGPEGDPDGWLTLEPVCMRGTVFGKRAAEVYCMLSLAKPLCYTRGTAIPCCMELCSSDIQALDLLSSPNAIVVRLRRRVAYRDPNLSLASKMEVGISTSDSITDSESAVWWPSVEGAAVIGDSPRRLLSGEVHLQKNLKPTTAIGNFCIEYSIALFPSDASAFTPLGSNPLLIHPVQIATAYPPGPRPRTYSPPVYQSSSRPEFYSLNTAASFM
ncbi:hypothetical protein ONZ45_g13241 [Pleurotus djamor]|nr:hypothetical protein ONZ45_g13241 [Pleurotus djamor]